MVAARDNTRVMRVKKVPTKVTLSKNCVKRPVKKPESGPKGQFVLHNFILKYASNNGFTNC